MVPRIDPVSTWAATGAEAKADASTMRPTTGRSRECLMSSPLPRGREDRGGTWLERTQAAWLGSGSLEVPSSSQKKEKQTKVPAIISSSLDLSTLLTPSSRHAARG